MPPLSNIWPSRIDILLEEEGVYLINFFFIICFSELDKKLTQEIILLIKCNFFLNFSLRGIIFDIKKGNFVKLDTKGYVLR